MSKKDSLLTSNQSQLNKGLTMIKLVTVKGNEQDQFKNLDRVEAIPHMDIDVDTPSSTLTSLPPTSINDQNEIRSTEKSSEEASFAGNASSTSKEIHKHKHHHHGHGGKHHHRHSCRHRPNLRILSPSKLRITNLQYGEQEQQPLVVEREVPSDEGDTIDTNTLASVSDGTKNEITLSDDEETNTCKGNIPLQSIENKITSQRIAPTNEAQVGNYPSIIYTQSMPSICNTGNMQAVEQIYYEDDCCSPSLPINCASESYILQQPDPCVCLPQQQQIQYCTDLTSQGQFCSPSCSNLIQQVSLPQQQFICGSNLSSTNIAPQSLIYAPQAPVQRTASFVIQQQYPQIQSQPLQIIQSPQTQSAQYIQISSGSPQLVQTIQVPTQAAIASPQILYQHPYASYGLPIQNQQLMSQPSYAPIPIVPAVPAPRSPQGANMFRYALARTVANQIGSPVLSPSSGGLQLVHPPMVAPPTRARLASTASALLTGDRQGSPSVPIVPLTAGGLLIPFQPSGPSSDMKRGTALRARAFPSNLTNFDKIRQQIQQRSQLLANFQQRMQNQLPTLPVISANATPPLPSTRVTPPAPTLLPSARVIPPAPPMFSTNVSPPSLLSSRTSPLPPPPVISSQNPYPNRNIFGSSNSSSSSSTSSASSARRSSNGPTNARPPLGDSSTGSISSGPVPYQSFRP